MTFWRAITALFRTLFRGREDGHRPPVIGVYPLTRRSAAGTRRLPASSARHHSNPVDLVDYILDDQR